MQNLIFFYSSTRNTTGRPTQVWSEKDIGTFKFSTKMTSQNYLDHVGVQGLDNLRNIFLKNVCFALVVYIIDSIIELKS